MFKTLTDKNCILNKKVCGIVTRQGLKFTCKFATEEGCSYKKPDLEYLIINGTDKKFDFEQAKTIRHKIIKNHNLKELEV